MAGSQKQSWLCRSARALRQRILDWKAGLIWKRAGCSLPAPPHIKRALLRKYARAQNLRVFIETGTLFGDTLAALRSRFDRLHSIELSDQLYAAAATRFADDRKVTLWHGDSGDVLPLVLAQVKAPALFWLDGHYSGNGTARGVEDTPIKRELEHIANHALGKQHHIIIDDKRLFSGADGYPEIGAVKEFARRLGFGSVEEVDDFLIIRGTANG